MGEWPGWDSLLEEPVRRDFRTVAVQAGAQARIWDALQGAPSVEQFQALQLTARPRSLNLRYVSANPRVHTLRIDEAWLRAALHYDLGVEASLTAAACTRCHCRCSDGRGDKGIDTKGHHALICKRSHKVLANQHQHEQLNRAGAALAGAVVEHQAPVALTETGATKKADTVIHGLRSRQRPVVTDACLRSGITVSADGAPSLLQAEARRVA